MASQCQTERPDQTEVIRAPYDFELVRRAHRFKKHAHRQGVIYFVRQGGAGPIKIGFTTDLSERLRGLQTASPLVIELLATRDGTTAHELTYHERYRAFHVRGEWFEPHPDILAEIERLKAGAA